MLHVLQRSAPFSHILPLTLPIALCNLARALCYPLFVCSLNHNRIDEEAKQALRIAWRGAPSQLEL